MNHLIKLKKIYHDSPSCHASKDRGSRRIWKITEFNLLNQHCANQFMIIKPRIKIETKGERTPSKENDSIAIIK